MRDVGDVVGIRVADGVDAGDVGHEASGRVGGESAAVESHAHVGADARMLLVGETREEGRALHARAFREVDAEQIVFGERRRLGVLVCAAVRKAHETRDCTVLDRDVAELEIRLPAGKLLVGRSAHLWRVCSVHEGYDVTV